MDEIADAPKTAATYSAPALEKGLDVLELLAAEAGCLGAKEIAARLRRSLGEIFRMLVALERRGYIRRGEDGGYTLTLRLFEVAHRSPPLERLIAAVVPEMRIVAERIGQSCHLTQYHDGRILVIARVESPQPWSLMVRTGGAYDLLGNPSGRVLLAFQPEETRRRWQARALEVGGSTAPADLTQRLEAIRTRGHEAGPSETVAGITSLSCPILSDRGRALAALNVPFLAIAERSVHEPQALTELCQAAKRASARLGSIAAGATST